MPIKLLVMSSALVTLHCPVVCAQKAPGDYQLIAHRGGVVNEHLIEHSLAGLQAAIERGYRMVEIDVRQTKDGRPVAHHDRDFQRYYNHPHRVDDMTWQEIKQLRSKPGGQRPLMLSEFASACRGKVQVMVEIKGPAHDEQYYKLVEQILLQNDLLKGAYMIGIAEAKQYFRGKLRTSVQRDGLEQALAAGEDVANLYFLFDGARVLDADTVELARTSGVPIVAAMNIHHYRGEDGGQRAYDDLRRMQKLEIQKFQIDSAYDRWFLK